MRGSVCPTLCDPMDCSPPGPSVHGILQARILEWVAISFFRESSQPRDRTWPPALQADSLPYKPPGKPQLYLPARFFAKIIEMCGTTGNSPCTNLLDFSEYS